MKHESLIMKKMTRNQRVAFWSIFIAFCGIAIVIDYHFGTFEFTDTLGGSIILVICYLSIAATIRMYIVSNPDEIDSWFE